MGGLFTKSDSKQSHTEIEQIKEVRECLDQLCISVTKISSILSVNEGILKRIVNDIDTPDHQEPKQPGESKKIYKVDDDLKQALENIQKTGILESDLAMKHIQTLQKTLESVVKTLSDTNSSESDGSLKPTTGAPEKKINKPNQNVGNKTESLAKTQKTHKKETDESPRKMTTTTNQPVEHQGISGKQHKFTTKQDSGEKKEKVSVQMHFNQINDLISKAALDLEKKLSIQASAENIELEIVKRTTTEEIESNQPVLVLCINASRLGTDVSTAIKDLPDRRNAAVVVLHYKLSHALPSQSSNELLVGHDYQDLARIVDIAYLVEPGIYPCDMNDIGLSRLIDFVRSQHTETNPGEKENPGKSTQSREGQPGDTQPKEGQPGDKQPKEGQPGARNQERDNS